MFAAPTKVTLRCDLGVIDPLIWLGADHAVTRQLARVATFPGGFAGFYATVYAASDKVYRARFSERITTDLERALAVRRAYVADRRRHHVDDEPPATAPTGP